MKSLTIKWHILESDWSVRPIIITAFLCKNVLRYFGKVQCKSNVCIILYDWLIALYLFISLVFNAGSLIIKNSGFREELSYLPCFIQAQLQQITVKEHIFGEFVLVNLTFGSCTSPTENIFSRTTCAIDNFQRLIFVNSQSCDKFTRNPKIVSHPTSSQESLTH